MVVAASCCGNTHLKQGPYRRMKGAEYRTILEANLRGSGCKRLEGEVEVHLPSGTH